MSPFQVSSIPGSFAVSGFLRNWNEDPAPFLFHENRDLGTLTHMNAPHRAACMDAIDTRPG